jgi:hypothetical protein
MVWVVYEITASLFDLAGLVQGGQEWFVTGACS